MEDLSKTIGTRIREKREKAGISQKDLAEKVGVTPSAINQYENGTKKPSTDILAKIAVEIDTSSDYLLGIIQEDDEISINFREFEKLTERDKNIIIQNIKFLKEAAKKEGRK